MSHERLSPSHRTVSDQPACPYAIRGLDAARMHACPSFVPADVSLTLTVSGGASPQTVGTRGVYCRHLGLQPSRRTFGFSSACTHPTGPPAVAVIELLGRRRGIEVQPAPPPPAPG